MIKIYISEEHKFIFDQYKSDLVENTKTFKWIENQDKEFNFNEILDLLTQTSLFNTFNKLLILQPKIFDKSKSDVEKEFVENLSKISFEQNIDISIYMVNKKTSLPKWLISNYEIKEIPKLNYYSSQSYIEKELKKNSISYDNENLIYLKNKLNNDPWIISNEIKKISCCSKKLTKELIDNIVIEYSNDTIFKLISCFLRQKYEQSIKIFNDLINQKMSIEEIFSHFCNYIFKLKTIHLCFLNNKNIKDEFKLQDFQVNEFISLINSIPISMIDNLLNILLKLDKDNKKGLLSLDNSFRLFLVGGINGY